MPDTIPNLSVRTGQPEAPASQPAIAAKRPSRGRLAAAFAVAAVSDILAVAIEVVPPLQWVLDFVTALLLFLILGRRWAILPGLVAEAIPGLGVFPVWVLVVLSIYLFDDIKRRRP